ncbi:hypothetical protein NAEGRDRAFT_78869 [Naegleria gruberi]|uniref:Uncharacterized protein n=1 Tax=Naegleria gruberi TaxID=5762 RepID=D2V7A0_NAEGR|nr:uncharacterized protein NAEGRDRAFT_78869 [Naegleria gruberi]EFC47338.1 hypothetical protein NAEGRDRAFT_78869 [Naegleria gruberi]|eukprot:XP_002680082.1 hypothetical protein NAEGRDRAFT_78869 [Naegleria gruberi strain NEG-M]
MPAQKSTLINICKACTKKSSSVLPSRVFLSSHSFHTTTRSLSITPFGEDEYKIGSSSFKQQDAKKVFDLVYEGNWNGLAELKKEREGKVSRGDAALEFAKASDYKSLISLKQHYDAHPRDLEIDDMAKIIAAFGQVGSVPDAELTFGLYIKRASTDREVASLRNALLYSYLVNGEEEAAQTFFVQYPVKPTISTYNLVTSHSWKNTPTKLNEHLKSIIGGKQ